MDVDVLTIRCSGGEAQVPAQVPHGKQIENWRQGRFYEHLFLEYLRAHYHGGTWVDGGSALGNHTLFMAKFCACEQVISIDPIGPSLEIQKRILDLNGVRDRVLVFEAALSDWSGFGHMERFGPGVGHWSLASGHDVDGVSVTRLDDLRLQGVRVLKLDVEGSELAALRGAGQLLRAQGPAVFTECNEPAEVRAIGAYLGPLGYTHGTRFHTMHEWVRA